MNAADIENYVNYVSPEGRAALLDTARQFQAAYGKDWLKHFKRENPGIVFFVDIIANHDAPTAFQHIKSYIDELIDEAKDSYGDDLSYWLKMGLRSTAALLLNGNYSNILETHRVLREEIDRPRF